MIYFRKRKLLIPTDSKESTEQALNQATSKILNYFDLERTLTYVISEERPFAGKKADNGEVLISRYRHVIYGFVPRIVTNWKTEIIDGKATS